MSLPLKVSDEKVLSIIKNLKPAEKAQVINFAIELKKRKAKKSKLPTFDMGFSGSTSRKDTYEN